MQKEKKKKRSAEELRGLIFYCAVCVCVCKAGTRTELSSSDVLQHLFISIFCKGKGVTKNRWEKRPEKEQIGKKKQGLESMWAAWETLTHRVRETRYNYPTCVCVCVNACHTKPAQNKTTHWEVKMLLALNRKWKLKKREREREGKRRREREGWAVEDCSDDNIH